MATITAATYAQHKPNRAALTPGQQEVYDAIEEGALEFYDDGPDFKEPIDLYFAALNKRDTVKPTPKSAKAPRKATGTTPKGRKGQPLKRLMCCVLLFFCWSLKSLWRHQRFFD